MSAYAVKVVRKDGVEHFLCEGIGDVPARFPSRAAAQRQADFMKIGMENIYQAIVIVKYPAKP